MRTRLRLLRLLAPVALTVAAADPASAQAPRREYGLQCVFNDDCAQPLICGPGNACRAQCRTDRDCANGWVCRQQLWVGGRRLPDHEITPGLAVPAGSVQGVCVAPGPGVVGPAPYSPAPGGYAQPPARPGYAQPPVVAPPAWKEEKKEY